METTILNVVALVIFALLLAVSGGVVYLTIVEWRDRRRQDRDKKSRRQR